MITTATKLIHQAALASPEIPLPNGKTITYQDIKAERVEDPLCFLCGDPTGGLGLPTKKAIKPTFTDVPLAAAQDSRAICDHCAFCISRRELRNYSIFATRTRLSHPSRAEWRDILLDPPPPPFVACIATSGQRWLSIRAQVAYARDNYPVQVEDVPLYVDRPILRRILELAEDLYTVFTKEEIARGEYQSHRIQQYGIARLDRVEGELQAYRGLRLFSLALLVAQKKEEE